MNLSADILNAFLKRKLVTVLCIGASLAAFATLGDGGRKNTSSLGHRNMLSLSSTTPNYKNFSLKSGYNYRGNSFLNTEAKEKFIMLNTVVTYQKGNATYILPIKKKLFLDSKITFKPAAPQR